MCGNDFGSHMKSVDLFLTLLSAFSHQSEEGE